MGGRTKIGPIYNLFGNTIDFRNLAVILPASHQKNKTTTTTTTKIGRQTVTCQSLRFQSINPQSMH